MSDDMVAVIALAYAPIPPGCGKDTGAAVAARLEEARALLVSSTAAYSEGDDVRGKSDAAKAAKLMAEAKAAMDRCARA